MADDLMVDHTQFSWICLLRLNGNKCIALPSVQKANRAVWNTALHFACSKEMPSADLSDR
tara:strand:+ start:15242 stop:15421 length:180 start_codon:yes stop_codon:yes gene_type:complete